MAQAKKSKSRSGVSGGSYTYVFLHKYLPTCTGLYGLCVIDSSSRGAAASDVQHGLRHQQRILTRSVAALLDVLSILAASSQQ